VAKRRPVSGLRSRRRGAGPAAVTADKRRRRNLICAHPAGTLPGKRRKGGPRTSWNGYITTRTGLKPEQLMRQVEERLQRRQTVHSAANPQTEDAKDKTVSYCTSHSHCMVYSRPCRKPPGRKLRRHSLVSRQYPSKRDNPRHRSRKTAKGRPKTSWNGNITALTGLNAGK